MPLATVKDVRLRGIEGHAWSALFDYRWCHGAQTWFGCSCRVLITSDSPCTSFLDINVRCLKKKKWFYIHQSSHKKYPVQFLVRL